MLQHVDSVIKTVRKALCDPLPEVRACAAITFNNLYKTIGVKALNDIIPDLLEKLVNVRDRSRALIRGGVCIFIYLGSVRLISLEIRSISKAISRAEPEYMNMHHHPN